MSSENKKRLALLQIVLGSFVLGFNAFRFIRNDYHLPASDISITLILGVVVSASGFRNYYKLKRDGAEQIMP